MAFRQNSDGFPNLTVKGSPTLSDIVYLADVAASNAPKQATFGSLPLVQRAGDTMTGLLVLSGDPVTALGAATKQYVDSVATGLTPKEACFASTTANLNATYNNGAAGVGATLTNAGAQSAFSTDGETPIVGDRILVQFQTAQEENGIYEVTNVGSGATNWVLTRTTDFDQAAEMTAGSWVIVTDGALYSVTSWVLDESVATVGTDPVNWVQFTAGVGANRELSNLATTSINASLQVDGDGAYDLGDGNNRWRTAYLQNLQTGTTAADALVIGAWDVDGASLTPFFTLTAGNTPTAVLASAVTGTTQSANDNSTKLATTAYADTIAALKANVTLNNLSSVAINTTLVSDTDITDDLGTQAIRWRNVYTQTVQTGDTAADTLSIGAWDVDGGAFVPFFTLTANNTPTAVLASSVTATTQAPADNSAKLATTAYVDAATGGGSGANVMLSNLSAVAINTTLVSDTDITDDLGTQAIRWRNVYTQTVQTGDTAADTLSIGAWDIDGAAFVPFFTLTANNTPTGVLSSSVTGTTQAPGTNTTQLATTAFVQAAVTASSGANTALSNLAAVAINTSLVSDTDATDDLGSGTIRWANTYTQTLRTGTGAANTLILQARDVDGSVWTNFITLTANNTPTCALASGVTAVTQSANDNSTKIATTAYVDAASGPTAGGSLILLGAVSTASTAAANFDNLITSTYDHYFFTIEKVYPSTNATTFACRIGTGPTPTYQSANYDSISREGSTGQTSTAQFQISRATLRNTDSSKVGSGYCYIHNANDSAGSKAISGEWTYHNSSDAMSNALFGGWWTPSTVLTSAQFTISSGTMACHIRMYGIKNS